MAKHFAYKYACNSSRFGAGASVTGDKAVGFGQNAAAAGGYSIAIGSNSSTMLTVHEPI